MPQPKPQTPNPETQKIEKFSVQEVSDSLVRVKSPAPKLDLSYATKNNKNIFSKLEIEKFISRPSSVIEKLTSRPISISPEKLQKQNSGPKLGVVELDYASDYVYKESPGYGGSLPAENLYRVKPEVSRLRGGLDKLQKSHASSPDLGLENIDGPVDRYQSPIVPRLSYRSQVGSVSDRPEMALKSPRLISPLVARVARPVSDRGPILDMHQEPLDTTIYEETHASINSDGHSPYRLNNNLRVSSRSPVPIGLLDIIKSQVEPPLYDKKSQAISNPLSARTHSQMLESQKSPVFSKKSSINKSSEPILASPSPPTDNLSQRLSHKSQFPQDNPNSSQKPALARRESENSFKKPVLPLPHSKFFPTPTLPPTPNPLPQP